MAKNLILTIQIPIQRRHEISWLFVKNGFKSRKENNLHFYNNEGDTIFLILDSKIKQVYDFQITFDKETDSETKIHLGNYGEFENFLKSMHKNYDSRQTE